MVRHLRKIIFLLMLVPALLFAQPQLHECYTYTMYTGGQITVAWDTVSNADGYRWKLSNYERPALVISGDTTQTQVTITLPDTGHWEFTVLAYNTEGESTATSSKDPAGANVGGQAMGWWLHGWVAPPTGPEIE